MASKARGDGIDGAVAVNGAELDDDAVADNPFGKATWLDGVLVDDPLVETTLIDNSEGAEPSDGEAMGARLDNVLAKDPLDDGIVTRVPADSAGVSGSTRAAVGGWSGLFLTGATMVNFLPFSQLSWFPLMI